MFLALMDTAGTSEQKYNFNLKKFFLNILQTIQPE